MFESKSDVHPTNIAGRTLWLWKVTYTLRDASPTSLAALGVIELQGVATSLDSACAEMRWAEQLTALKLRFMGYAMAE